MTIEQKARELAVLGWLTFITNVPGMPASKDDAESHVQQFLPPDSPAWLVEGVSAGLKMYQPHA